MQKSVTPSPDEIIAARKAAKLTQTAAAALVYATCRAWQLWEAGDRKMGAASWELFRIKCEK
jgi:putative transcriptional regulator